MKKLNNMRVNYQLRSISQDTLCHNPMKQFEVWFSKVVDQIIEPNAMVLSTYDKKKGLTSRVVLLKEITWDGFIFYTNFNSLKGQQIEINPQVSLCFFWPEFQQQVRINGQAVKISHDVSDQYFKSRPRKSQIASWVSQQSSVIDSRKTLEQTFSDYEIKFQNTDIPKPDFWGGYKVVPDTFEFWQGGPNRMHDRFLYKRDKQAWIITRLSP